MIAWLRDIDWSLMEKICRKFEPFANRGLDFDAGYYSSLLRHIKLLRNIKPEVKFEIPLRINKRRLSKLRRYFLFCPKDFLFSCLHIHRLCNSHLISIKNFKKFIIKLVYLNTIRTIKGMISSSCGPFSRKELVVLPLPLFLQG